MRCSDTRTGASRRQLARSAMGSSMKGSDANPRSEATCIGG